MKKYDAREGYDIYVNEYEKDHGFLDSFDWDISIKFVKKYISARMAENEGLGIRDCRILDVGCGDARVLKRIERYCSKKFGKCSPKILLYGIDISRNMLDKARKDLKKVQFSEFDFGDSEKFQVYVKENSEKYDVIVSFFVMVHMVDLEIFFNHIQQLLRPGGYAVFNNIPQKRLPVLKSGKLSFKITAYHHVDNDVEKILSFQGLKIIEKESSIEKNEHISTVYVIRK